MTPTCARATEVEAALDGRLSPAQTESVLAHARGCLRCREATAAHAELRHLLRELPRPRPDDLAARRMKAAVLRGALRPGETVARGRAFAWGAVAAALLLVAGVVTLRRDAPREASTVTMTALEPGATRLGAAGYMVPEEGASVRVVERGATTRVHVAEGGALFAVLRRRAGERFLVRTDDAEVEVRGTRFTVRARDGRLVAVDVQHGRVAVRVVGRAERVLAAGERWSAETVVASEAPRGDATSPPTVSTSTRAEPTPPRAPASPRAPTSEELASRDFREGALAYVRHDDAAAQAALGRFLARSRPGDGRREDARYVQVLALRRSGDPGGALDAAEAYLREFPRGVRRAEVAAVAVQLAAALGDCDRAARLALTLPEEADARFRGPAARALAQCGP